MTEDNLHHRQWDEDESRAFLEWADVVVPARAEQIQILRQLIPAHRSEAFAVAELGAGDGRLASAILERLVAGEALGSALAGACEAQGIALEPALLAEAASLLSDLGERGVLLGAL